MNSDINEVKSKRLIGDTEERHFPHSIVYWLSGKDEFRDGISQMLPML